MIEWNHMNKKQSKQLEKYFKGVANHYRLEILFVLDKDANLTLDQLCERVEGNAKTVSGHTRRLVEAGLLNKKYEGLNVHHALSPYGKKFAKFAQSFL